MKGALSKYKGFFPRSFTTTTASISTTSGVRIDNLELRDDVQKAVFEIWPKVTTENLNELTDFSGYKKEFLKLFGFGLPNVDYKKDVEI